MAAHTHGLAGPNPLGCKQDKDTAHRFQVSLHGKNSTPFLTSSQVEQKDEL